MLDSIPGRPRFNLPEIPNECSALLDGALIPARDREVIERRSPAHDVPVSLFPRMTATDVNSAVAAARKAADQRVWSGKSGAERGQILTTVAHLIERHADELGALESLECGKPVAAAEREVKGATGLWTYAATLARHTYGDTYDQLGNEMLGLVLREPVGVVGIITPWNYPLVILSQKLPFALAVGCCAVVKPSELACGTALKLGELLVEAGVPSGVVNILSGYGDEAGQALCENPGVDMISFTGSTRVGKMIGRLAGDEIKKVSLELGGKSAHIVCADADLEAAAGKVALGATRNAGQACVSGSRLLVERSIAAEFTDAVVAQMGALKVGDPLEPGTDIGPLVSAIQLERVTGYIGSGVQAGARRWSRDAGEESSLPGYFVQPTVFTGVRPDMQIAQEEIFGPVLSVIEFDTVDEAIAIANGTIYGLAAGLWTRDLDKAFYFGRRLRAGTIEVNTYLAGVPELPLGGHGQSGVGVEKSRFSIEEFTHLKTIHLQLGTGPF